jgi:hypothetical protein
MIEFAQGFIGDPAVELMQFGTVAVVMLAVAIGWTWWYQHGS